MSEKTFEIAAVPAQAGTLAICPCPGFKSDYAHAIQDIAAWGADLVVSMTTFEEMKALGAEQMPDDLAAKGIKWLHFSVRDYHAASAEAAPVWRVISQTAHRVLCEGGKVLLHCKGGCGRSGMVALRLLVEAGEEPILALERLRQVRPCAVETKSQTDWAMMR